MDYLNFEKYNPDWAPYWQPNNDAHKCSSKDCAAEFGLINRKHHCRDCGKIFCYECCHQNIFLEKYKGERIVCKECVNKKN